MTDPQDVSRGRLSNNSKLFTTLPRGLRIAWENFASQHPVVNRVGDQRTLSSIAMFNKVNNTLSLASAPSTTTPPPDTEVTEVTFDPAQSDVNESLQIVEVFFDPEPMPANTAVLVYMTPAVSPARENVNNLFKFVGVIPSGQVLPIQLPVPANVGTVTAGLTYVIKVETVNTQNGFRAPKVQFPLVAT